MTNEDHRRAVEELVKKTKPVLVVFDPLYLMFDGDLNSSKELNPILNWLLRLKSEYETSVMVVHHYNKGSSNNGVPLRGGARMAGSIMLYGWVESAWYLSKTEDEEDTDEDNASVTVQMVREFRMSAQPRDIELHIEMGEVGDDFYNITETRPGETYTAQKTTERDIIEYLGKKNKPMSKKNIRDNVGASDEQFNTAFRRLQEAKKIVTANKGFTIPKKE